MLGRIIGALRCAGLGQGHCRTPTRRSRSWITRAGRLTRRAGRRASCGSRGEARTGRDWSCDSRASTIATRRSRWRGRNSGSSARSCRRHEPGSTTGGPDRPRGREPGGRTLGTGRSVPGHAGTSGAGAERRAGATGAAGAAADCCAWISRPQGDADWHGRLGPGGSSDRADRGRHVVPGVRRAGPRGRRAGPGPDERGVLAVGTVENPRQLRHRRAPDGGRPALRRRPRDGAEGRAAAGSPWRPRGALPAARRVYLAAEGAPLTQAKVAELAGPAGIRCWWRVGTKASTSGSSDALHRRVSVDRRLCAERRRAAGADGDRRGGAAAARHARRRGVGRRRNRSATGCSTGRTTRGRRCGTGGAVPPVLSGGNHAAIQRWRLKQALGRTWQRRPDLLRARGH